MSLFNILVDIAARTADFESAMDRVEKRLDSFGETVKRIGELVGVGLFVSFTKEMIDLGDQIDIAAKRAHVSAEAFQELSFVAKESGVNSDLLTTSITHMSKALSDAATGAKVPRDALAALGLTIKDLQGLSPDRQFEVLADRISKLADPAQKARAEIELFGRAGAELGALFSEGAEGIEKARKEAQAVGAVFSDETIQNLEAAHQSIDKLEKSFESLGATLAGKVAPLLSKVFDNFTALINNDQGKLAAGQVNYVQSLLANLPEFAPSSDRETLMNQLRKATYQQLIASSIVSPESLSISNADFRKLLGFGTPPGYSADQLREFHISGSKELPFGGGVPALLKGFDKQTATEAEKAADQVRTALSDLDEQLKGHAIDQETYAKRWNAISDSLQEVQVTAIHMRPILSEAQKAWNNFSDDVESALKRTVQETGSFGRNLLRNLLQALEDRAIFKAIEDIGTALRDAFNPKSGSVAGNIFDIVFGKRNNVSQSDLAALYSGSSDLYTGVASLFGGAMASGGPLEQGKWYTAGEHGPEPIWGGGPGAFAAGYGGQSTAINYAPVYNIGAGVSRAEVIAAAEQTHKRSIADMTRLIRGGAFT